MATYEPYYAMNSQIYNIASEGELANILSRYNSDFVFNVVKDNIAQRNNRYGNAIQMTNIVGAYNQQFILLKDSYHSEADTVTDVMNATYKEIIDILCKDFHLEFRDTGELDYYSVAFWLYDFLVSNFDNYVISFFSKFIYNEANTLFDALNMSNAKKNKDTSTIYSKKMYEDSKFAIVASNLGEVLYSISGYDIDFQTILSIIDIDQNIAQFIASIVYPIDDFYKNVYCAYILNEENFPVNLTNIRLDMQRRYSIQNNIANGGLKE